jgi:hypothetical protein
MPFVLTNILAISGQNPAQRLGTPINSTFHMVSDHNALMVVDLAMSTVMDQGQFRSRFASLTNLIPPFNPKFFAPFAPSNFTAMGVDKPLWNRVLL